MHIAYRLNEFNLRCNSTAFPFRAFNELEPYTMGPDRPIKSRHDPHQAKDPLLFFVFKMMSTNVLKKEQPDISLMANSPAKPPFLCPFLDFSYRGPPLINSIPSPIDPVQSALILTSHCSRH